MLLFALHHQSPSMVKVRHQVVVFFNEKKMSVVMLGDGMVIQYKVSFPPPVMLCLGHIRLSIVTICVGVFCV